MSGEKKLVNECVGDGGRSVRGGRVQNKCETCMIMLKGDRENT